MDPCDKINSNYDVNQFINSKNEVLSIPEVDCDLMQIKETLIFLDEIEIESRCHSQDLRKAPDSPLIELVGTIFNSNYFHSLSANCFAQKEKPIYQGASLDGVPHGEGNITFPNGDYFQGFFTYGLRAGQGTYIYANKDTLSGMWENDKLEKGMRYYKNLDQIYRGGLLNGLPHGYGIMSYADASQYEGNFEGGLREGYGVLKSNEKTISGIWERDILTNGIWNSNNLITNKGGVYEGELLNGIPHGEGSLKFQNGDYFKGTFNQGVREGVGTFIYSNKDALSGDWKNNLLNNGTRYYKEADQIYRGPLLNGVPHGKGRMSYFDGSYYEGFFINGIRQRHGVLVLLGGDKLKGYWINDKLPFGKKYYTFQNIIYQGSFSDKEPSGKGQLKYLNKDSFTGYFDKGIGVGAYTFYSNNKTVSGYVDENKKFHST